MADSAERLKKAAKVALTPEQEAQLGVYVRLYSAVYDRASGYTKGVVAIGYASIFAVWKFTEHLLPKWAHALVALLLIVSVMVFTLWEVFTNVTAASALNDLAKRIAQFPDTALASIDDHDAESRARSVQKGRLWKPVVWTTILTSAAATGVMLWFCIASLIDDVR